MPSFNKLLTLAAFVVAALAVPACEDARLVKCQSIPTAGGVISLNSFSCAPRGAVASKRGIVNVQGETCVNSCDNNTGILPPVVSDCDHIQQAIQILENSGAFAPTFTVVGHGQQNIAYGTCNMTFTNLTPNEVKFNWQDFADDGEKAASACFSPSMSQVHPSEALCDSTSGKWSVATVHSQER